MAVVTRSILVAKSAQTMFDLVDQVEDYPLFLPWCSKTELLERSAAITAARIHARYHGLHFAFATENHKENTQQMRIHLREGPFRKLEGCWQFTPLSEMACKVEFHLEYEFSSKIFDHLMNKAFTHIAKNFIDAFVQRAQNG